jgi:hypothetical protein
MRVGKSIKYAQEDTTQVGPLQLTCQGASAPPLHQLHRQPRASGRDLTVGELARTDHTVVIDRDDPGVVQTGYRLDFQTKGLDEVRSGGPLGQEDFESDRPVALKMAC